MEKRELSPNYEYVDHPSHYQGKIECIDYLEDKLSHEEYIGFLKGSVMKYMDRLGKKEDDLSDSKKAAWYLSKLIALYQKKPIETATIPSVWETGTSYCSPDITLTSTSSKDDEWVVVDGNRKSPTYGKILTAEEQEQRRKFWEECN